MIFHYDPILGLSYSFGYIELYLDVLPLYSLPYNPGEVLKLFSERGVLLADSFKENGNNYSFQGIMSNLLNCQEVLDYAPVKKSSYDGTKTDSYLINDEIGHWPWRIGVYSSLEELALSYNCE